MQDKLLELLLKYSIDKKEIDKKYYENIISIISNDNQLENYVENFKFVNSDFFLAQYQPYCKSIVVSNNAINLEINDNKKIVNLLNNNESYIFKYLIAMQLILHELEHARQTKISSETNSFEQKIFKLESCDVISYKKHWDLIPSERLAEIYSYNLLSEILSKVKKIYPNIFEYISESLLFSYIFGYVKCYFDDGKFNNYSTTVSFIKKIGKKDQLLNLDWYDENNNIFLSKCSKFSLEERLKYGLIITEDEYKDKSKKLFLTKKWNQY